MFEQRHNLTWSPRQSYVCTVFLTETLTVRKIFAFYVCCHLGYCIEGIELNWIGYFVEEIELKLNWILCWGNLIEMREKTWRPFIKIKLLPMKIQVINQNYILINLKLSHWTSDFLLWPQIFSFDLRLSTLTSDFLLWPHTFYFDLILSTLTSYFLLWPQTFYFDLILHVNPRFVFIWLSLHSSSEFEIISVMFRAIISFVVKWRKINKINLGKYNKTWRNAWYLSIYWWLTENTGL